MIQVIATITLADGRRDEFLAAFRQVVPKALEEEGCLEYGPMIDVPTSIGMQSPSRENVVAIVEKWESVSALETHLTAPHMLEYRKAVKEMIVGSELRILEPA